MKLHNETPVPWRQWGELVDQPAIDQMNNAAGLPIAAAAALMPDAHVGYGLPIGGVLATRRCIIPYAVGVDIACRMKLSVLDLPLTALQHEHELKRLTKALEGETRFGVGAEHRIPEQHDVMDRDWCVSPVTREFKAKAWRQLGTSGSGNHFVEFGLLTIHPSTAPITDPAIPANHLKLDPGVYVALLSHSGSRGTGAAVCDKYSKLAMEKHPDLPKEQQRLAWLDLTSQEGHEYWEAMNLMGEYASANHAVIHRRVVNSLGAEVLAGVENHHNFAWKETHVIDGHPEEVFVHRKGATPAGAGTLGVIPGSMATPGFVVRGRGSPESLNSASHGAGRVMSRAKAKQSFVWGNVSRELKEKGIKVLSAGIDEVPGVYKDIHAVMEAQSDLVEIVARFDPKLVKMAPSGEPPED